MDLQVINEKLDFLIENMTEKQEVFTSYEAAEYLRISYDYLLKLAREGEIDHKKKGNDYLFRRDWLNEWLEN